MQLWKIRLPDGRTLTPGDWSSTPLWTTVEINDGAITPLRGYSYGVGQYVPGSPGPRKADYADTNMKGSGGTIPENEELLIYKIMIELFRIGPFNTEDSGNDAEPPMTDACDVLKIQRDTLVVMRIAESKEYLRAPLGFLPAGMGVYEYNSAARNLANFPGADLAVIDGTNGSPTVGDERELATPHRVLPGEPFEITLEFPYGQIEDLVLISSTARIRARIYVDGYRRRPVA